jgi:uncharacterized protein YndB with AHSA1/START domain
VEPRPSGLTLHLERTLPARPDRVFAACVEAAALAEWWGPEGFTCPSVELDVRAGGAYRIAMQPPEGELFHLRGTFLAVDRPSRLVYTFEWEPPDPDDRQTVVTLTFGEADDGTELVLDQGPFATAERQALHEQGWTETLARLKRHLVREKPS